MEHSDFVSKYRSDQIVVSIDKNAAGYMYEDTYLMPQNLRTRQALIRTVAFGGLLVSVVLFFFVTWWLATIVLLLSFAMFPVAQKQAARGVLDAALADPRVYKIVSDNNVLVIKELA